MKTMKKLVIMGAIFMMSALITATAQIATNVAIYHFPVSLPDVTTPEFGTARDNHLTRIKMGGPLATSSRVNNPTGLEMRSICEAGDMSVSVSSNLWRYVFNPGGAYATQRGQREYDSVAIVGIGGKVSQDRVSYQVFCGVGLLSNQASLAGLDYSISRIGILSGSDGKLFTPDDVFVQTGSGTNLVDAIVFIGARVGALVENNQDLVNLNASIGSAGTYIRYEYSFAGASGTITDKYVVTLYQQGGIPSSRYTVEQFRGPIGRYFSLVGPAGSAPIILKSARDVDGPWFLENASATEGASVYFVALSSPNDHGFVHLGNTQAVTQAWPTMSLKFLSLVPNGKPVISASGSETDQDR